MSEKLKKILKALEDARYEVDRAKSDLDDAESYIEKAEDLINEQGTRLFKSPYAAGDNGLEFVIKWFESPFVNDYDKQTILNKYGRNFTSGTFAILENEKNY